MNQKKLNWKNTLLIGFGFLASSLAWSLYNSFVPVLLEERFIRSTALIGLIMTIDNFFGIIFQPLVGTLSDKTVSPLGRRMPWILAALPVSAVLLVFIPRMQTLTSVMTILIFFNFFMSLWRSPVISLMPDVTAPILRSSANGVINLMGGIGAILAFLAGGKLATADPTLEAPFMMGAVGLFVSLVLLLVFVREPARLRYHVERGKKLSPREEALLREYDRDVPEGADEKEENENGKLFGKKIHGFRSLEKGEKRSLAFLLFAIFAWFSGYNAIETFFTLYATNALGVDKGRGAMMLTAFSLTFLVFAVPSGLLAQKIGRKRMIVTGLAGLILCFLPILFIQNATIVLALLLVGGIFWSCININSLPMVVELARAESIGSFTGYYYFFSFAASIVSPILFGFIRDLTKDYGALFPYAAIFFLLALLSMRFVKHGEAEVETETAVESSAE